MLIFVLTFWFVALSQTSCQLISGRGSTTQKEMKVLSDSEGKRTGKTFEEFYRTRESKKNDVLSVIRDHLEKAKSKPDGSHRNIGIEIEFLEPLEPKKRKASRKDMYSYFKEKAQRNFWKFPKIPKSSGFPEDRCSSSRDLGEWEYGFDSDGLCEIRSQPLTYERISVYFDLPEKMGAVGLEAMETRQYPGSGIHVNIEIEQADLRFMVPLIVHWSQMRDEIVTFFSPNMDRRGELAAGGGYFGPEEEDFLDWLRAVPENTTAAEFREMLVAERAFDVREGVGRDMNFEKIFLPDIDPRSTKTHRPAVEFRLFDAYLKKDEKKNLQNAVDFSLSMVRAAEQMSAEFFQGP